MTKILNGVYTVMITPTNSEGGVQEESLRRFVEWQVESGIHGLVALGSTGEFLSLSQADREAVTKIVIEQVGGRVPVLIGAGAEDTRDAVAAAKLAEGAGADGVMVIPPYYSTPTEDELVHHYGKIASAIGIPVMVYNNPATSNVDLIPPIVARLAQIEGCDYIKKSTMDVTRIRDIIDLCGDSMQVFGGIMGYESFLEGAIGWVCVASNAAPREMARIFELVQAGEILAARELYFRWLSLIRAVGGHRYVAGSKALLNHMGLDVGTPLPPRLPLPASEDQAMKQLVADWDGSRERVRSVTQAGDTHKSFSFLFEGRDVAAVAGQTIAGALVAAGITAHGVAKDGTTRGYYCGMGVCHDCSVKVEGVGELRSCLAKAEPGMAVSRGSPMATVSDLASSAPTAEGGADVPVDIVIVGAGPGGLSAGIAARQSGASVIIVDERSQPGGQYYKQPGVKSIAPQMVDRQSRAGAELIDAAIAAGVEIQTDTMVWGAFRRPDSSIEIAVVTKGRSCVLRPRTVIVATGAYERPALVPGWTLPGAMTPGGAQALLRTQGVLPGKSAVIAGNGPLNFQLAEELLRLGAEKITLIEAAPSPWRRPLAGVQMALSGPTFALQGMQQMLLLIGRGVDLRWSSRLLSIDGDTEVEAVQVISIDDRGAVVPGTETRIHADVVLSSSGFIGASEIARQLGVAHKIPQRVSHGLRQIAHPTEALCCQTFS